MGNSYSNQTFEERTLINVSQPINKYINNYLKSYSGTTGIYSPSFIWNKIYESEDFEMLKQIEKFNIDIQQRILDQSFGYRSENWQTFSWKERDSLLLLQHWSKNGLFTDLEKLTTDCSLDFARLTRVNGKDIEIPFYSKSKQAIIIHID